MNKLSHEIPNNWRLEKFGIFKKIPEMLGTDGEFLAGYPKGKF